MILPKKSKEKSYELFYTHKKQSVYQEHMKEDL